MSACRLWSVLISRYIVDSGSQRVALFRRAVIIYRLIAVSSRVRHFFDTEVSGRSRRLERNAFVDFLVRRDAINRSQLKAQLRRASREITYSQSGQEWELLLGDYGRITADLTP